VKTLYFFYLKKVLGLALQQEKSTVADTVFFI